jgi:hypothetical protein
MVTLVTFDSHGCIDYHGYQTLSNLTYLNHRRRVIPRLADSTISFCKRELITSKKFFEVIDPNNNYILYNVLLFFQL